MQKHEGKIIVDQYEQIERILDRMDTILLASSNADVFDHETWVNVLDSEFMRAFEDLGDVRDRLKEKFAVIEYIQAAKKRHDRQLAAV